MAAMELPVLCPEFAVLPTKKFGVIDLVYDIDVKEEGSIGFILDINCQYTDNVVRTCLKKRPWCKIVPSNYEEFSKYKLVYQISDFENINWDPVMNGKEHASSYLVRKGLSRKAQLALQLKKYICKHPDSCLKSSIPFTLIVETWNAFESMKLNFGGQFASFDSSSTLQMPLRQKLEWCLEDVKECVQDQAKKDWYWILKPSVTNKGADISIARNWNEILDDLEINSDIREWVLQKYVPNPLLINGHKFHLRVYVLCVGALQVFVFDRILVLLAAHPYRLKATSDIHCHLTNTARAVEVENFDEEAFVKILDDLPRYLMQDYPNLAPTWEDAMNQKNKILESVHSITSELFAAFENEYTVFAPMSNCFELFGLDFLVDENLQVSLLEVNPGPDFKQTGERLRRVIVELWEQSFALIVDSQVKTARLPADDIMQHLHDSSTSIACHSHRMFQPQDWKHSIVRAPDFTLVYDKEWSASRFSGGMSFNAE